MSIQTDVPKYLSTRGAVKKINPEYMALMEPYLEEGMHIKGIAEVFGVHQDTVHKFFPGRGWTLKQRQELGTAMKHFNQKMRKIML